MEGMALVRATVAAVLSTGLVIIIVIQQVQEDDIIKAALETGQEYDAGAISLDSTFVLLVIVIVILVVPDAISYVRAKRKDDT